MYKVFIENYPIHFISNKEKSALSSNGIHLTLKESVDMGVELMLKKIVKHKELYILCNDLELDFKIFFKGFEFVEAAGGIVQRKHKFLFIKRNGFWDIPKGKLEIGEHASEGAIREVEEECGISKPSIDYLICETYHTYSYKGKPTIKKTYWYKMNYEGPKSLIPQIEEGITKVKWFKYKDFEKIRKNSFASILEVLNEFDEISNYTSKETM